MALSTIGSGLDVPTLVSQLVAAERAPTENRINNQGTAATAKLSALGNIKSSLSSLQSSLTSLGKSASIPSYKTTVADTSAFSASIVTDSSTGKTLASAGSYSVEVVSLAQSQKLSSAAYAKDAAVGDGTLTVAWGEQSLDVEIPEGSTLADIAAAINKAAGGNGVNASVITADDGQHLVLNAVNAGTEGALTLTSSGGNGGLDGLTWNGSTGGLSQTTAPSDAVVRVDGHERTSSSNTISDLVPGVTLTLSKATAGTTTTLTIAKDNTTLKTNLQAFVAAYNSTVSLLKSSSTYDSTTDTASTLTGDSLVRGIQQQLRGQVSGNVVQLKALGVSINKDGTLSMDSASFDKAVAADPASVDKLLGTSGSLYSSMSSMLKNQLDSTTGTLVQRTDSLNKQIKKLESDLDALDKRMEAVSARYTAQFTAMDTLVTQMQSTSDYLTEQLSALKSSKS